MYLRVIKLHNFPSTNKPIFTKSFVMQFIVLADEVSREEFATKKISPGTQIIFVNDIFQAQNYRSANAIFLLKDEWENLDANIFGTKPVFINSTIKTLSEQNLPENFIRINGWPSFLKREVWEVATAGKNLVKDIFESSGFKFIHVADTPGLVAARVICMIINEAYFALGDGVSSKEEIDLAMKLGTNYPYGPFEWCLKIGIKNVYSLLEKLSKTESRYNIAPALKNEFKNS